MKESPALKIFISAHKNTEYIQNDIFTPIQVGAAMRGRKKIPGFLYDDTGDNISESNDRFCELTAQYWAWKNFDAEYYGFFHYRRYLAFSNKRVGNETVWGAIEEDNIDDSVIEKYGLSEEYIRNVVSKYDIILPERKDITMMPKMGKNMREQYVGSGFLHDKDLDIMLGVLIEKYPDYAPYANRYLVGKYSYLNNMFIMRKDIFNDYCKWLFDILLECEKRIDFSDYSTEAIRTPGHLAERLLNIYVAYLKDHHNYRIKELPTVVFRKTDPTPELKPAFAKKNIAISMSADDYYVPYVAAVLASIRDNSSKSYNYDILIMNKDFTANSQRRLQDLFKGHTNFSLRFVDISRFENKFKHLFLRGHFTIETWFRLLMPEIMPEYDKVLYIDSDLIINTDIAELYKTDVSGYLLAACHDADTAGLYNGFEPSKRSYMDNILKIKKPYDYFQAGVILFNLDEFRKSYTTDEMLEYAASYNWQLLDQDVLNNLAQGRVKFIDMAWNVMFDWNYMRIREIISRAPKYLQDEYTVAHANPKIIHYAGPDKPWDNPLCDYAELFWKYSKNSGYYEECIMRSNRVAPKPSAKTKVKNIAKKILPEGSSSRKFVTSLFNRLRN